MLTTHWLSQYLKSSSPVQRIELPNPQTPKITLKELNKIRTTDDKRAEAEKKKQQFQDKLISKLETKLSNYKYDD
jgi:hypothetical protein